VAAVPVAALAMFVVGVLDDRSLPLSPLPSWFSSLIIGAASRVLAGPSPSRRWPGRTRSSDDLVRRRCHAFNLLDNMDWSGRRRWR
jgi:hypothetical protein